MITRCLVRLAPVVWLALAALPASAQQREAYTPRFNQGSNRLAPYVTSPQTIVDRMLEVAAIKPGEVVYDLGSGDGRVVITAAQRYKVKAVGVELAGYLVKIAQDSIQRQGLQDLASVIQGNMFDVDLGGADVVVVYLMTEANSRLRPQLERQLKPGARVVSHNFKVPGWQATRTETVAAHQRDHIIYLYEMPPRK